MNLERLAGSVVSIQELLRDIRFARGGNQSWHPVFVRHDLVDFRPRFDHAWPADHTRDSITTFPIFILLSAEGCCPAVGPRENLRTIVGCPDHDGVVSDLEIV